MEISSHVNTNEKGEFKKEMPDNMSTTKIKGISSHILIPNNKEIKPVEILSKLEKKKDK
jgi:hypothetical protein